MAHTTHEVDRPTIDEIDLPGLLADLTEYLHEQGVEVSASPEPTGTAPLVGQTCGNCGSQMIPVQGGGWACPKC